MLEASAAATTTGRRGGALRPWVVAAGGALALGTLALADPNEPGHYPTCPFLAATSLWCPGCGTLRATHALLHGDVATAWERNPLAVIAAPLLVLAWLRWLAETHGMRAARRWHPTRLPAVAVWGLLAVVIGYWIARNIPGWTWLSPA